MSVPGVIEWIRKVDNEKKIEIIVVKLSAIEFAALVAQERLTEHCTKLKNNYPNSTLTYIIEGLEKYFIRINELRESLSQTNESFPIINKKKAEEALLNIQFDYQCKIIQSKTSTDTNLLLFKITTTITTNPLKKESTFDGLEATIRNSYTNLKDCWISQLEQIRSVSNPIARSIVEVYPSINSLMNCYMDKTLSEEEKKNLLSDIQVEGQRRIGPSLSNKIYRVFTDTNSETIL